MSDTLEQHIHEIRRQFPALERRVDGRPAIFFDGPGGTQVPRRVIDAMVGCLTESHANCGGRFATSRAVDAMLHDARQAVAALLGTADDDAIIFGQNMTSLTFALARSLARTWRKGDQIVVTRLDHDANVAPWVLAARDAAVEVRYAAVSGHDCGLDLDDLCRKLSDRTRLVAVACASNATGGIYPVRQICDWAHRAGALVFVDAVHFAPHGLIDVAALDCDFLTCSAYKFFGPHVGILWGRRHLLETLHAYKVRPAPDRLPGKWMTGTQNHEGIAGTRASIDYLADLGRAVSGDEDTPRREALRHAFTAIGAYERNLACHLMRGLAQRKDITVWGLSEPDRVHQRVPTFSFTHRQQSSLAMAEMLASRGIFVWHGNYYALELTESLGLEPDGMVRVGLVHYNTRAEVDRLLEALS